MPKRSRKPKKPDLNQIAARIVSQSTGQPVPSEKPPEKNPAAVALGRLGGLKGGPARLAALTKAQRRAIAQEGAKARWSKHTKKPK
jgi:hypothetical protein